MRKTGILILTILYCIFAVFTYPTVVYAEGIIEEEICNSEICKPDPKEEEETAPAKTVTGKSFWVYGLMTINQKDYDQYEQNRDYITYFDAVAFGVPLYNINWSTDLGGNIIILLFWIITFIINLLGSIVVYFLLVIVNMATNGLIKTGVLSMSDWVNETVFGWNDSNNYFGISVIVVLGAISVILQVLKNYKQASLKTVATIVGKTILGGIVIMFITPRAIDIGNTIDESVSSFLDNASFTLEEQGVPNNIQSKQAMFDLFLLQPYLMQNFDVASKEALKKKLDELGIEKTADEFLYGVMDCSMGNKQETCLEKLYPAIKKENAFSIIHSGFFSTQIGAVPKAILLTAHKIILAIPFYFIYLVISIFEFIRWIALLFSLFFLLSLLFGDERYFKFFTNQIQWSVISWAITIITSIFIQINIKFIGVITDLAGAYLILAFDVILLLMVIFIWSNRRRIIRIAFRLFGFSMLFAGRSAMVGSYGPHNGSEDVKSEFKNLTAEIKNLYTQSINLQSDNTEVHGDDQNDQYTKTDGDGLDLQTTDQVPGDTNDVVDGDNEDASNNQEEMETTTGYTSGKKDKEAENADIPNTPHQDTSSETGTQGDSPTEDENVIETIEQDSVDVHEEEHVTEIEEHTVTSTTTTKDKEGE